MLKRTFTVALLFGVMLTTFSISLVAQDDMMENLDTCVEEGDYNPDVNYFPEQVELTHAEGFTVEYFNNYKVLTVDTPWEETVEYVLVQCGTPAPEDYDVSQIVNVPVDTVVATSTSFLPHLVNQGLVDRIVGLDSLFFTSLPEVIERIDAEEIVPVYADFAPDMEAFLALDPALTIVQDFSPDGTAFQLNELGLPAVVNYDFNDVSPLAQAEWGKYIALFFNTEAEATSIFSEVERGYMDLVDLASDVTERPTVMANANFQGQWYIPGGNSFPAQLFADAGADYLWADTEESGSLLLDFESVLAVAGEADVWVNVYWATLADGLAEDANYSEFAAFDNGMVYNNNHALGPNGGSLYFELGVANPDLILADLIAIFHPELLPEHELFFYQQLPAE